MKTKVNIGKKFWISNLLLLIFCSVMGQNKKVTTADYKLWSTLENTKISQNGNWVSYTVKYESENDTLFVKNVKSQKTFSLPLALNGTFIYEDYFAFLSPKNNFRLLNLGNGKEYVFDSIARYKLVTHDAFLLEKNRVNNTSDLLLINFNGTIVKSISGVSNYEIDPTNNKMVYWTTSTKSTVSILDFNTLETIFIQDPESSYSYPIFKWHKNGTSLLFVEAIKNDGKIQYDKLYFYRLKDKRLFTFNPRRTSVIPDSMTLDAKYYNELHLSEDESVVYFTIKAIDKLPLSKVGSDVQIWNAADKNLYPLRQVIGSSYTDNRLVKWNVEQDKFVIMGDNSHPLVYGHVDQNSVLLYNEDENKPFFTQNPDYTYWLFNTSTREKSLFLKQLPGKGGLYSFSPQGKYFLYSRDLNWWLYNFETNIHINLTEKYGGRFIDHSDKNIAAPLLYHFAGWSKDDQFIYIYDEFDIWELKTADGSGRILTNGRNKNEINRFTKENVNPQSGIVSSDCMCIIPGENCTIKITNKDNSVQGFSYLNKQKKVIPIVYAPLKLSDIKTASNSDTFIYQQESFNIPPALHISKNKNDKLVYQSNPHYKKFAWGRSKLVTYRNKKKQPLNAVLLYPADFNPDVKYPMIVYVYEKLTSELYHYSNPSLLNNSTINFSNFANEGYFVLLPDIEFELGNPGFSAVDCVTSAVTEVINNYPINNKKVGITGHSHGGYETDFIITQTDMFAAAAAGAAVTHFNSNYLDFREGTFEPVSWFYEFHQLRMGKTLFEDYDAYQRNSPVTSAANIKTPLLSYTGSNDMQVSPKQSNEFYQALRRLQKEHILLVYPNENHVFTGHKSQEDLSLKLMEWFNYYLKDKPKPNWMKPQ